MHLLWATNLNVPMHAKVKGIFQFSFLLVRLHDKDLAACVGEVACEVDEVEIDLFL